MKLVLMILVSLSSGIIFSCDSGNNQEENEKMQSQIDSLKNILEEKNENASNKQGRQKIEIIADLYALIPKVTSDFSFSENGDFKIDMGSASAGRGSGNLKELKIKYEKRPEEPGCADICPERVIVYFECKNGDCVSDKYSEFVSSSMHAEFLDIAVGLKFYQLIKELQDSL